jgi:hypothetical protein
MAMWVSEVFEPKLFSISKSDNSIYSWSPISVGDFVFSVVMQPTEKKQVKH